MAGLMAFSYPSAVIIPFIMIAVLIAVERKISRQTVFYILGGASTAVIALAILLAYVGFNHLIYGLNSELSIRSVNETSEGRNAFVEYVYQVVKAFVSIQRFLILPGILLVIVFLKSIKQKKYIWLLLWGIFLCAFINYINAVPKIKESYAGLNNFIGYVAVWAPFLYYLIPENQKNQKSKMLLYCLWLPAIVSAVAVSMVSIPSEEHGALKSWEAFLPAFMVSIYFVTVLPKFYVADFASVENNRVIKAGMQACTKGNIAKICCAILLIGFYNYYYLDQKDVLVQHSRMKTGIYAGIAVNEEYYGVYEELQNFVERTAEGAETVATGEKLRVIYLMGYMEPLTPTMVSFNWETMPDYYEEFQKIPDRIYMTQEYYNNQLPDNGRNFLEANYRLSDYLLLQEDTVFCFASLKK